MSVNFHAAAHVACDALGIAWEPTPTPYILHCERHNIISPTPLKACPVCKGRVSPGKWDSITSPIVLKPGQLRKWAGNVRAKARKYT